MTPPTPSLFCSACQDPISADELAQGLAVKVDGEYVCAMCVDNLPGKAQVEINRFRALKGLNATTYLVPFPSHPERQRFSFTTALNVLIHRRTLRDTGSFMAPPLPTITSKSLSSSNLRAAIGASDKAPEVQPTGVGAHLFTARSLIVIGAGATCVGLMIGLWLMAGSTTPQPVIPAPTAVVEDPRLRSDYPADPQSAWRAAKDDGRCSPKLLALIADELRSTYAHALDALTADLDRNRLADVRSGLDRFNIDEDSRFADARTRSAALRSRLAQIENPTESDPTTEPADPLRDVPADPAVKIHPSVPAAPECWIFTGTDIVAGRKIPYWKANGELSGVYGTLERALPPLQGGSYQLWIQAVCLTGRGTLSIMFDGVVSGKLSGGECTAGDWRPVNPSLVLHSGAAMFALKATSGPGWRIDKVYLAGSDRPGPDGNPNTQAPPWPLPTPEVVAPPTDQQTVKDPSKDPPRLTEPVKPVRAIADWRRGFVWPLDAKPEPIDGTVDLPSPWPSGAEPFQRSLRPAGSGRFQMLELDLAKASVAGGGVVALLHRVRANRKSLNLCLESSIPVKNPKSLEPADQIERLSIPLSPLNFSDAGDWQVFPIAFPDIENFGSKLWLKFEDTSDLGPDRGFLVGKVVTVANGPPEVDDIDLLPASLVAGDVISNKEYQHHLIVLMDQIAAHRASKKWNDPKLFDPRRIKLLVTNADKTWETQMRKELARVTGREQQNHVIDNLGIAESWFVEKQFKASQPLLGPDECSLLVLSLNGEEATCSLKDPDTLVKWTRNLVTEVINGDAKGQGRRGGFMPVLVIGRTIKVEDAARQAQIDAAWPRVREDCANLGIPLIDIRGAPTETLKHEVRDLSAQLLADGLRTLIYQISWAQKKYVR